MKLFGRKGSAVTGAERQVSLALPPSSSVTAIDIAHALAEWAGVRVTDPLPGGLILEGPRAAGEGEPEGSWVYTLSWPKEPTVYHPSPDSRLDGGNAAFFDTLEWAVSRFTDDTDVSTGAGSYAAAAFTGLARTTAGQVRMPGGTFAAPDDPEATWSVYLTERPEAETVLAILAAEMPGLTRAEDVANSWILVAEDGRSIWISDTGHGDGDDSADPSARPLYAIARLGTAQLYAVRIEGADDVADADEQHELAHLAALAATALGGVAVGPEGYAPVSRT